MRDFYTFISNRRSIRKFQRKAVSVEQLTRILEAGKWAPSAHNAQPWRVFVLQSKVEKEKLAKAMSEEFRHDLMADGEDPKLVRNLVEASIDRFVSAPLLILVCLTMEPMDSYPDDKRQHAEFVMGVQSVAAAIHTILLAAHAEGLGACWFCAPLFCPENVQRVLGLPGEFIPQALVTLGVADETPEKPIRHPVEEYVTFVEGKED